MKMRKILLIAAILFLLCTGCARSAEALPEEAPGTYTSEISSWEEPTSSRADDHVPANRRIPRGQTEYNVVVGTTGVRESNLDAALSREGMLIACFRCGDLQVQDDIRYLLAMEDAYFENGTVSQAPRVVTLPGEAYSHWVEGRQYVALMVSFPAENEYSVIGANDQCLFWIVDGRLCGSDASLVSEINADAEIDSLGDLMDYLVQREEALG